VLLTADGRVKICDMGLAKRSKNSTLTGAVGTLVYMAPEVFGDDAQDGSDGDDDDDNDDAWAPLPAQNDDSDVEAGSRMEDAAAGLAAASAGSAGAAKKRGDPRAGDVYSLGVVLWQLWHREEPFYGLGHHQVNA
jgi:serine/threonine protein kinase